MKLSSHEEYGLRCLLQIGKQGSGGSLTIPEISEAEGISTSYVGKLMRILRRGGLVKSTRGQAGGYTLSRPADRIPVSEVLDVLGGRLFAHDFCQQHAGEKRVCTHSLDCSIRSLWSAIQVALDDVLGKTTLQDLLRNEREMTNWITGVASLRPTSSSAVREP